MVSATSTGRGAILMAPGFGQQRIQQNVRACGQIFR